MKDITPIKEAFSSTHRDRIYILDKNTLKVFEVTDEDDEDYKLEIAEKVQKSPDRYIPIPKRQGHQSFEDMRTFINTKISNKGLQEKLRRAISTEKGAFSRFKDTLSVEDQGILREWYEYLEECIEEEVIHWLRENYINI